MTSVRGLWPNLDLGIVPTRDGKLKCRDTDMGLFIFRVHGCLIKHPRIISIVISRFYGGMISLEDLLLRLGSKAEKACISMLKTENDNRKKKTRKPEIITSTTIFIHDSFE